MSNDRDPERDQPLPTAGRLPVQGLLIQAIRERAEHGRRKYGRYLETDNGRDALQDAWEEAIDLVTYLTQLRLERGDILPGMRIPEGHPAYNDLQDVIEGDARTQDAAEARLRLRAGVCRDCGHEQHPGRMCGVLQGNVSCWCGIGG